MRHIKESVEAWKLYRNRLHPIFWLPGVSVLDLCADIMHMFDLGVS